MSGVIVRLEHFFYALGACGNRCYGRFVPDSRRHRGADPADERLFGGESLGALREATADLCWLLDRGYAIASATELVGNRYSLAARQRLAVARCACSEVAARHRESRRVDVHALRGEELWLDGLNVLTGLEVALSGGIILIGRDDCCRDIAGLHSHYRKVEETVPAAELVGELCASFGVARCCWWLDKPVSNTGRLKAVLLEVAARRGWKWTVELVYSPDSVLAKAQHVIATGDSAVLDRCQRWFNLVRVILAERIPAARTVALSVVSPPVIPERSGCGAAAIGEN